MYMIRHSRAPMLIRAGREMMRANNSFRMPFAALISLNTRPILNTLRTRSSVGLKLLARTSANTIPAKQELITYDIFTTSKLVLKINRFFVWLWHVTIQQYKDIFYKTRILIIVNSIDIVKFCYPFYFFLSSVFLFTRRKWKAYTL